MPPGLVHKSTCQRCVFVFTTPSPPAQRGGAKLCPSQTCRGVSPVGSPEVTRQSQDGRGRAKAQGVVTLRLGLRRWLSNRGRLGIVRPSHPQVWVWKGDSVRVWHSTCGGWNVPLSPSVDSPSLRVALFLLKYLLSPGTVLYILFVGTDYPRVLPEDPGPRLRNVPSAEATATTQRI